ncbi:methyl-accepting chemotaxis protein [Halanaerobium sp. MA284_MarDTE_T2]|uniref:methyl-accepting chemotaxis protein n=1 Tax=Halanaerobium sp. MA284_MarDTE_T2 TaxID=2183913 RepID=UPI000DF14635|nr:methyl-accepting chemotaxis protein [Halanaerobium sp. MA284_MarDTE_T2]RCW47705.1 methyl-accepting chemotaxis sensory transducer with Cache sensor [Halanaerobium sp. MA284_MarDTE_T2]
MLFNLKEVEFNSIRTKIILIVSILILILITVSSVFTYFQSQNILEESIYSAALDKARNNSQIIEMMLNISTNSIKNLDRTWFDSRAEWDSEMMREFYFINHKELFVNVQEENPYISSIFITDNTGTVQTTLSEEIFDISEYLSFKKVSELGEMVISNPVKEPGSSKDVILILDPVMINGELKVVFGGTLPLEEFAAVAENMKIRGSGHGFIFNSEGYVIAHQDEKYIGNKMLLDEGGEDIELLFNEMFSGQSKIDFYELMGGTSGVVFSPIKSADWSLGIMARNSEVMAPIRTLRYISLGVALLAVLIGIAVSYYIAKYISEPILSLRDSANIIAEGDLTERVELDNDDEIGDLADSFNKMVESLKDLISNISNSAEKTGQTSRSLLSNAEETSKLNDNVASSVEEFSASIEEVAASAEEFAATTESINKNVQEITSSTDEVNNLSEKGVKMMQKTEKEMEDTLTASSESIKTINKLNDAAEEIDSIVNMISGIAEQTNLLALNAAIEAARAGDAGRGFAVVADEIRELAEETKNSTEQIRGLIENLQDETQSAVIAINSSNEQMEQGADSVAETAETFNEITDRIKSVAAGIKDTASGINDLSKGSKDISRVTEEQAVNSDQIAEAAQKQSKSVEGLKEEVDNLKI